MNIDPSTINLDTRLHVKILSPAGQYLPEVSAYIPYESTIRVQTAIEIMNRGISIDFVGQSSKKEISKRVEDLILEYMEQVDRIREVKPYAGTDVNTALDVIQDINESRDICSLTTINDNDEDIFSYKEAADNIKKDLSDNTFRKIFSSDFYKKKNGEDPFISEERKRKHEEALKERKKKVREMNKLIDDTWKKFIPTEYNNGVDLGDIEFV